jgi:hypothetical protein
MYAALSDHARRVGLEELFGRVREDDEGSLAALGKHGFREIGRDFPVVLDLRTGRKDRPPAPDGVEIRPSPIGLTSYTPRGRSS